MFINTPGPAKIKIFVKTFDKVCHSMEKLDSNISAGKKTASKRCGFMCTNASKELPTPDKSNWSFNTPMHISMTCFLKQERGGKRKREEKRVSVSGGEEKRPKS